MSHEIGTTLLNFLGALANATESDEARRERLERHSACEFIKVAGVALTAIAAVAALYAILNGMFFTTLFALGVGGLAVDVAKVGINGANATRDYTSALQSIQAIAQRQGITNGNELATEVLLDGTIVIGSCLRPLWAAEGPPRFITL